MGGAIGFDINLHINTPGGASTASQHIQNAGTSLHNALIDMSDKLIASAKGMPIPKAAQDVGDVLMNSAQTITDTLRTRAGNACGLIGNGTMESGQAAAKTILDVSNTASDAIGQGFDALAGAMVDSFNSISEAIAMNTQFSLHDLTKFSAEETNEVLLLAITVLFTMLPFLFYLFIIFKEKEKREEIFYKTSWAVVFVTFIVGMMQLIRYLFSRHFTITNITICFFLAFYMTFCLLYILVISVKNTIIWCYLKKLNKKSIFIDGDINARQWDYIKGKVQFESEDKESEEANSSAAEKL